MVEIPPLRREGNVIRLYSKSWKILRAENAICTNDGHLLLALNAATKLELSSFESALALSELLCETAVWTGYSLQYRPVFNLEGRFIWWDAVEQTGYEGGNPVVISEPVKPCKL